MDILRKIYRTLPRGLKQQKKLQWSCIFSNIYVDIIQFCDTIVDRVWLTSVKQFSKSTLSDTPV